MLGLTVAPEEVEVEDRFEPKEAPALDSGEVVILMACIKVMEREGSDESMHHSNHYNHREVYLEILIVVDVLKVHFPPGGQQDE